MKLFACVLAFGLAFTFTSQAEVLIYKQKYSRKKSGGGSESKTDVRGWTVIDTVTGELGFVNSDSSRREFEVEFPETYSLANILAGDGKSHLVFKVEGIGFGGFSAKGRNVPVQIGAPDYYSVPRTLTVSGSDLYEESDNDRILLQYKGTLILDADLTQSANRDSDSFNAAVERLRQKLLARGYTEEE